MSFSLPDNSCDTIACAARASTPLTAGTTSGYSPAEHSAEAADGLLEDSPRLRRHARLTMLVRQPPTVGNCRRQGEPVRWLPPVAYCTCQ